MKKKFLSSLLLGMLAFPSVFAAGSYGLAPTIQEGNILHCFDWKMSDITAELENIAAAGFTSVQLSPLQRDVQTSNAWYDAYRPFDFKFSKSALGTADDLKNLTAKAHSLGMFVIVDVVANHVDGTPSSKDSYHASWWNENGRLRWLGSVYDWNNRYQVTHHQLGGGDGYPDVNSEDYEVANRMKDYIQTLKSYGVDGIRWDAAKHIGLPSEGCQFWKIVTEGSGLYHYGEILDGGGMGNNLLQEYATFMSITDNEYGDNAGKNNGMAPGYAGLSTHGVAANKLVYWGESHDTFANDNGWSKNVDQSNIDRAYAINACRNGEAALYFSRPSTTVNNQIKIGAKGSTHFTSKEVAEVNKFRNAMRGKKDYYVNENGANGVMRQDGGAVIVKPYGGYVSIANGGKYATPGTYKDRISGNTFTVTSDRITGEMSGSGIAVIYDGSDPGPGPSPGPDPTPTGSVDISGDYNIAYTGSHTKIYVWNGSVNNGWPGQDMATVTGSDGKSYKVYKVPSNMIGKVIFTGGGAKTGDLTYSGDYVMDNNGATSTKVTFNGGSPDPGPGPSPTPTGAHYIYYDGTFSNPKVWAWKDNENCTSATAWPGDAMVKKDNMWYWEVPAGKSVPLNLIISENGGQRIGGGNLTYNDKYIYHQDGSSTPAPEPGPTPSDKPSVSISPNGGNFTSSISVTITATPSSAKIYYTIDGSTPSASSSAYTGKLTFTSTTTLKAIAINDGVSGDVKSATFTKGDAPTPTPDPERKNLITKYYNVNDKGFGSNRTIISGAPGKGALSNWQESDMIAQGVARDICQAFKGGHEYPIVDSYSIYGGYDNDNLYLGVQLVNAMNDKIGEAKPYNMDGGLIWAFDLDPNKQFDGYINGEFPIWAAKGLLGAKYQNGVDAVLMCSTKPGVGTPGFFLATPDGHASYDAAYCKTVPAGFYGYADGLLPSITHLWGNPNYAYDPQMLETDNGFEDLMNQYDKNGHTFYEFKIPLTSLGITADYIRNTGIGVMFVDRYGVSPHGGVPYDPSYFDNALLEYSADPSSSKEKEDEDIITYSPARIGRASSAIDNVSFDNIDSSVKIIPTSEGVIIKGLNGQNISIFNSLGALTKTAKTNESTAAIKLDKGIQVVKVGTKSAKISVR